MVLLVKTKFVASKTLFLKAFGGLKIAWTKARLLNHDFPVHRQHEMLPLPMFGHFPARKIPAGKSDPAFGNAPGFSPLRPPQPSWAFLRYSKMHKWIQQNALILIFPGFSQQDVNGEKLTMKKWWIFGADLFHGSRRVFHGL